MRIYLDDSVISRAVYDGEAADFIREQQSATIILNLIHLGLVEFVASEWLLAELAAGDPVRAQRRLDAVPRAIEIVGMTDDVLSRAKELSGRSMSLWDALHVASAEASHCDFLLTFDNRHVRGAMSSGKLEVAVQNALTWVREVYHA